MSGPWLIEIGASPTRVDRVKPFSSAVTYTNSFIHDPRLPLASLARLNWLHSQLEPAAAPAARGTAPAALAGPRRQRLRGEPARPVGAGIDMPDRAAPAAVAAVVGNEPVAQCLVGCHLQARIEAGADRKPGLVQHLVAI